MSHVSDVSYAGPEAHGEATLPLQKGELCYPEWLESGPAGFRSLPESSSVIQLHVGEFAGEEHGFDFHNYLIL